MGRGQNDAALTEDPVAVLEELRAFFKGRDGANLSDFTLNQTLGQGTYGRVRLAENKKVVDHDPPLRNPHEPTSKHSGFFAIKIMKKSEIIRLKQTEHVKAERDLLLKVFHPFIMMAYGTYKDERNLYLILEYVPAGEVLAQFRRGMKVMKNEHTQFYVAQLVMALQYLHADDIVFRGLSPDNLVIDSMGYLKLVDFGNAKQLPPGGESEKKTFTLCGTAEYLAPEIVNQKGHGKGVDWWALGVCTYEMLSGYPPFWGASPQDIYKQILAAAPKYPDHLNIDLYEGIDGKTGESAGGPRAGLICRLLTVDVAKRIGCLKNGAEDIKKHKWFRGLNWAELYNKATIPPGGPPILNGDNDASHFAEYPDSVEESGPFLEPAKQAQFDYWC